MPSSHGREPFHLLTFLSVWSNSSELTVSSLLKYEVVISELWDSLHMAGQSEAKAQAKPTTPGAAGPRGAAGASWVL